MKKFIENIEKTSSKIQILEFLQSVNSFGNKEEDRVTGASNLIRNMYNEEFDPGSG